VQVSATRTEDSSTPASGIGVARRPVFVTTHWSVVLKAAGGDTHGRDALAKLCQTYWYPIYHYLRRRGYSPHDAQDHTQGFFACLLERESLANADPGRGRFRSFLLGAMNHFLADESERLRARKRGGGCEVLSLDLAAAEGRFDLEPADDSTPDKAFDKQWALTLLNEVLVHLEEEYQRQGKAELFEALKQTLAGTRESQPYAAIATQLSMNQGAVKVAVHRLRKRYRELLQERIADTVATPEQVSDEMRHLFLALGS
jgi:RNA polymerase sigma factor (sigma-70 family)